MERLKELDERVMREGFLYPPYWQIYVLFHEQMWREAFRQAKEEVAREHPDWARQWPELFR